MPEREFGFREVIWTPVLFDTGVQAGGDWNPIWPQGRREDKVVGLSRTEHQVMSCGCVFFFVPRF